jgi:hypothetical protein
LRNYGKEQPNENSGNNADGNAGVGEEYQATREERYEQSRKPSRVRIMFKQNRSIDLKVGRTDYHFEPYGEITVSKDVVEHPDFIQQLNTSQ